MNILFVCRGNTARSQVAEALFNKYSSGKNQTVSAGTLLDNKEHVRVMDRPNVEPLLKAMNDVGLDISENIRKELSPGMIEAADKVIVMAEPETIPDYLRNSDKAIYWEVPDPKGQDYEGMCKFRDDMDRRIRAFVEELEA